jgi:hypothetical protein
LMNQCLEYDQRIQSLENEVSPPWCSPNKYSFIFLLTWIITLSYFKIVLELKLLSISDMKITS